MTFKCYDSDDEIKAAVKAWLRDQDEDFCCNSFVKFVSCWWKWVTSGRDYTEKHEIVMKLNTQGTVSFFVSLTYHHLLLSYSWRQ
jgi:hypothetical protein